MHDLPDPLVRVLRRVPAPVRPGAELLARTATDAVEDRAFGLSAEIAFFVVLSLPPLLLALVGLGAFVGDALGTDVQADIVDAVSEVSLAVFEADTVRDEVVPLVVDLVSEGSTSVVSIGFLLTVFAASRALRALVRAITIAYDLEATRATWQQFVRGILLTIGGLVVGVVMVPVLVAGPGFGGQLVDWLDAPAAVDSVWRVAYWPGAFVVVTVLVAVLYHQAAPWVTPWRRDLPGAALATTLGLLASVGLRLYSASAFGGASTYGPVAAPLALLLWLYAQSLALILGAELNAEIERMWPTDLPQQKPIEERIVDRVRSSVGARVGR